MNIIPKTRKWTAVLFIVFIASSQSSCDRKGPINEENPWLRDVRIESSYTVEQKGTLTLEGKGFASGDKLILDGQNYDSGTYAVANLTTATASEASFALPETVRTGYYDLTAQRSGEKDITLAAGVMINVTVPEPEPWLRNVRVEASYALLAGAEFTIEGEGFAEGDKLLLDGRDYESGLFAIADLSGLISSGASFTLPAAITTGDYDFMARRGGENDLALAAKVRITLLEPDPNITGTVYGGGVPLAGVAVSDGFGVALTDSEGRYGLLSGKQLGYVFVSIPANYMPANIPDTTTPEFFKRFTSPDDPDAEEIVDFSLEAEPNGNYAVITATDFHLAGRTNRDLQQFRTVAVPDMNKTIADYAAAGTKTYILTMGDLTWDAYWYTYNYFLDNFLVDMALVGAPAFHCMGNHDNDQNAPIGSSNLVNDTNAERTFQNIVGPSYYSFNLGSVHYVVIDNIMVYSPADRKYYEQFTEAKLNWLKKDLATVDKDTPIVVTTHAQLSNLGALSSSDTGAAANASTNAAYSARSNNFTTFMNCFAGFSKVDVFTGHSHTAYNINYSGRSYPHITEHNVPAVCATWWWTGRHLNDEVHVCKDGAPGGYGVFEMAGKDMKYRYKGFNLPADKQFRTYDRNMIHMTAEKYGNTGFTSTYTAPYDTESMANQVLINVWNWGPGWRISVTEDAVPLTVTQVRQKDPYHIVSYELQRLKAGSTPTTDFITNTTHHMFSVTASSSSAPLQITVTDSYGRNYSETMTRPKQFPVTNDEIRTYYLK